MASAHSLTTSLGQRGLGVLEGAGAPTTRQRRRSQSAPSWPRPLQQAPGGAAWRRRPATALQSAGG
eukprot:10684913-Lingulodinium_polyedra.AAC.1